MKRIAILLTAAVLMAFFAWIPADGQTASPRPVKPKSAQGHIVPMRHDQLTLYPHGRPTRRHSAYSFTPHRFNHPTPIQGTFMGTRY
jgi:hypothetical protein